MKIIINPTKKVDGVLVKDGGPIAKETNHSEKFFQQLAKLQNPQAIDFFVQNQKWDSNLDKYLFYYLTEERDFE